jgi:hypothetical protein
LKENNLNDTAKCLHNESSVILNYIEDKTYFASKVDSGRWDEVLEELSQLNLPLEILFEVHEQVKRELEIQSIFFTC